MAGLRLGDLLSFCPEKRVRLKQEAKYPRPETFIWIKLLEPGKLD